MTAEGDLGDLQRLARRVRDLVACGAVGLLLGCPDETMRHPLLDLFAPVYRDYIACYGAAELLALLDCEWVRALIDLALQSGQVRGSDGLPSSRARAAVPVMPAIRSLAVAPVESPAGVLGCFLLADVQAGAFCAGERRLLEYALRCLAKELEERLRALARLALQRLPRRPALASQGGSGACGRCAWASIDASDASVSCDPCHRHRQLDQLGNEFISMVSHELRTPLTAIKGYAGLLQAYGLPESGRKGEAITAELQRHYLNVIMEQVNHLEVLAGDLLDISRIHANHLALRCAPLDIAALCRRVVELLRHRVEREAPGRYRIHCLFSPQLPPVWADADRVQQILTNLLENAVKYSPAGGVIRIEAAVRRGPRAGGAPMMYVRVCDQGVGISAEQQSRLFKPFSRLEHPATGCVPGVGLGLYITRRLVEAMGGRIELRSREGRGTSVTFTLPLAPPMAVEARPAL
jgi:nitrogen-specific signal transduction histidine kinase